MQKTNHAFIHRIYVRLGLVAALVGCISLSAHAGFIYPSAPGGWRKGSDRPMATGEYAAKTVLDSVTGNVIRSGNELVVPAGNAVAKLPVAYRLQAAAGRIAAAAIFKHPVVRAGVGIGQWLGISKVVYDAFTETWRETADPFDSNGFQYRVGTGPWASSLEAACAAGVPTYSTQDWTYTLLHVDADNNRCRAKGTGKPGPNGVTPIQELWISATKRTVEGQQCPAGWTQVPQGCISPALTEPQMVELLNPPGRQMPSTVPMELPYPTYLPVDPPIINPGSGIMPVSRPLFVPSGNPIANPNYNPNAPVGPDNQPWIQPGVRLVPSPTVSEPWRIDAQPVNRPTDSPEPTEPKPEDDPNPGDKPKPEEQQSLCEKHPDILACSKPELDTPEGEIPKKTREVTLNEENLFGGGSCPADVYFSPHGLQQLKVWDWNRACGYISSYVKPILILCCTFAAFMILIPGRTE